MARKPLANISKEPPYVPPPPEFLFLVGDKYYYRLLPIPYKYKMPDFSDLKKKLELLKKLS